MTQPGSIQPAAPGWWVRTNRIGICATEYNWAAAAAIGSLSPEGVGSGSYSWVGAASGTNPVTYVNSSVALATSVAIPTHAVGDIIIICTYRNGSNTSPSKPAAGGTVPAWTDILKTPGSGTQAMRTAYFVATATTTTSGTWGSDLTMAVVLRHQGMFPIGGNADGGGSNGTTSFAPSVGMTATDGTSMLLHFFAHRGSSGTLTWDAAPAGYTQRAQSFGSTQPGLCLNTKNVTTSDGLASQDHTTSAVLGYWGTTIEILG